MTDKKGREVDPDIARVLLNELNDLFGWQGESEFHALAFLRTAVTNLRGDLRTEKFLRENAERLAESKYGGNLKALRAKVRALRAEVEALRARVAELEARMAVPRSHEPGGCYKYVCHSVLPDGSTLDKVSYRSQDGADECARCEGVALASEGELDHVFAVVTGPLTRYRLDKGVVVVEPVTAPVTEVEGAFQEGS
jgi:hypothetical protein